MAPTPYTRDNPTEFPGVHDEKRRIYNQDTELPHPVNTPNPKKKKMATSTRIVIAVLFGMMVSMTLALGPRIPGCLQHRQANAEESQDGLHKLLHDHLPEKFKDGVYPTDEEAVRALHEDHAELATSLIQLAKRQNNNTTDDTPEESTTTPDDPTPTDEPTEPTTTPDDPPTTKETTTTTTSSSSNPPRPTPTTSDDDEPETSTTKKTSSKSSTVHTRTSTLPGGDVTIVTSTSYYDVLPEETGTNSNDPSLQNAAPGQTGFAMPALLVAIAGGLLIL